jgi:hypothetical protein
VLFAGYDFVMADSGLSARQEEAAGELAEWREDVAAGIGPRVVVLGVPEGWGRSRVLAAVAVQSWPAGEGDPVTFVVRIEGRMAAGAAGAQAAQVRDQLARAAGGHRLARTLGLDRPQGVIGLAVGAGSLGVSGLGLLAGLLAFQEAVTAAGNARDASRAGEPARRRAR